MDTLQKDKLLSDLCTFGVGGPARYFAEVNTIEKMQEILVSCQDHRLSYLILGKGSNCLFDDKGFDGVVILNKINFYEEHHPGIFHVGAGYSFSLLGAQTARKGWSGLEFASGIPGSIGGAVFMNAGANGRETCESLTCVDFVDANGGLRTLKKEELHFAYRSSSFHQMKGAIVGATFTLNQVEGARKKQLEIIAYRQSTQPYGEKTAGCMFRNPNCGHAGALIEKSGLKGAHIGSAKVSEKHANFIVNSGNASCDDILQLVNLVKEQVKEKTGEDLESEVRYIPYTEKS